MPRFLRAAVDFFTGGEPRGAEGAAAVRSLALNADLGEKGRNHLEEIFTRIAGTEDEGEHLRKLRVMMQTPYAPAQTAQRQSAVLRQSVLTVRTQQQRVRENRAAPVIDDQLEERKAASPDRRWEQHVPARFVKEGEWVRVDRSNPNDLLVQIKVYLKGEADKVDMVRALEDAIEKHLGTEGFTVDLVLTDAPGDGVYTVKVDPEGWTTSRNWIGDHQALAHELMHLLGVDDEYDYTSHHNNSAMTIETRLGWYLEGIKRGPMPPDAEQGIMVYNSNKPLRRQIDLAVGLSDNQYGEPSANNS